MAPAPSQPAPLLAGCEETVQNDTPADRLALFGGGGNDVPTLHAADFQKGSWTLLKRSHWNLGHSLERLRSGM